MKEQIEKLLYSRHHAASALSISVRSLDYLVANKKIPTRRIGKKVMIPAVDLKRFASANHYAAMNSTGFKAVAA